MLPLYDLAGDMTGDNTYTYGYNAESEIKSAAGVNYTYDAPFASRMVLRDGDGKRVEKSGGKIYWDGAGTEILDESDGSGNFTNEYVFFGGKRIAMRTVSTGTIYYYEEDMLGSSRTMVQAGQTSACYDADFYPYGGEIIHTNSCATSQNYKFTGKERDAESGLDYFGARHMASVFGRFQSSDLVFVDQHTDNPQSWNLYAYAGNNPLRNVDPSGRPVIDFGRAIQSVKNWFTGGVARDGSVGAFAKNNAIGAAKGTGTFGVNTLRGGAAMVLASQGNIVGAMAVATSKGPAALEPSNKTQAQASTATQVTLTVASVAIPFAGEEEAGVASLGAIGSRSSFVFYSGPGAQAAAEAWSAANNGTMIQSTIFGQAIENGIMTAEEGSAAFANSASGTAQVFSNDPLTNYGNIWYNTELPILADNPSVTNIVFNPVPPLPPPQP